MKIPVEIRVENQRTVSDFKTRGKGNEATENDSFLVSGTMKKTKKGYRIEYTESEESGATYIDTLDKDMVAINRNGAMNTNFVFINGKTNYCIANTGFFSVQMCIRTKSIENSITMDGGKLDIDYSVEIGGNLMERTRFVLSVWPHKSIIKS